MVLIIVMGGNVIVFFHGGVSLLTGIAHYKSGPPLAIRREVSNEYVCVLRARAR